MRKTLQTTIEYTTYLGQYERVEFARKLGESMGTLAMDETQFTRKDVVLLRDLLDEVLKDWAT